MKDEKSVRNVRAEMEAAKQKSEKVYSSEPKQPKRYKIYDKIKDRVSLRTIDAVIAITAGLIVALLIIGITTGNHG